MTRAERRRLARVKAARDLVYIPYDVEERAKKEMPKTRRRRTLLEMGLRDDSAAKD